MAIAGLLLGCRGEEWPAAGSWGRRPPRGGIPLLLGVAGVRVPGGGMAGTGLLAWGPGVVWYASQVKEGRSACVGPGAGTAQSATAAADVALPHHGQAMGSEVVVSLAAWLCRNFLPGQRGQMTSGVGADKVAI